MLDRILYVWLAVDLSSPRRSVYKVGITTAHLHQTRIQRVSSAHGCRHQILIWTRLRDAQKAETAILKLGSKVSVKPLDGHTEFVTLSKKQISQVIDLVRDMSCECVSC